MVVNMNIQLQVWNAKMAYVCVQATGILMYWRPMWLGLTYAAKAACREGAGQSSLLFLLYLYRSMVSSSSLNSKQFTLPLLIMSKAATAAVSFEYKSSTGSIVYVYVHITMHVVYMLCMWLIVLCWSDTYQWGSCAGLVLSEEPGRAVLTPPLMCSSDSMLMI